MQATNWHVFWKYRVSVRPWYRHVVSQIVQMKWKETKQKQSEVEVSKKERKKKERKKNKRKHSELKQTKTMQSKTKHTETKPNLLHGDSSVSYRPIKRYWRCFHSTSFQGHYICTIDEGGVRPKDRVTSSSMVLIRRIEPCSSSP
jgi:hypothetical protein